MPLPSTFTGSSYGETLRQITDAIGAANGLDLTAGVVTWPPPAAPGETVLAPRLANGQAAALIRGWRTVAGRHSVRLPLWLDLASFAYGARPPAELRFKLDPAWQDQPLPREATELVWRAVIDTVNDLDAAGVVARPVTFDWSRAGYVAGAREAWAALLAERGGKVLALPWVDIIDELRRNPPRIPPRWEDTLRRLLPVIANPVGSIVRSEFQKLVTVGLVAGVIYFFAREVMHS